MIFGLFRLIATGYRLWIKILGPKLFWLLFAASAALAVLLNHLV